MNGTRSPSAVRGRSTAKSSCDVRHVIDAENENAEECEGHGHQAQANRDRRDDGDGREGGSTERTEGVQHVTHAPVDERGASLVTALVGGQWHGAEARERPVASVDGADAVVDLLPGFALDMERKLLVQLAFHAARSEQRAKAKLEIAQIHRGYASFITRPIAVAMRSHSPASTASCRRPDAVSR